jgi:hypothetical protein
MSARTASGSDADFWIGVAAPFLVAIWLVPCVLLRAWALVILWRWYVVPTFAAPELRMAPAFGLALIVSFLTNVSVPQKDKKPHEVLLHPILNPLLCVLMGWIGTFWL